jgi:hypothetical protein
MAHIQAMEVIIRIIRTDSTTHIILTIHIISIILTIRITHNFHMVVINTEGIKTMLKGRESLFRTPFLYKNVITKLE